MKQISILTLVAALLLSWTEVNEIKWVRTLEDGLKNQKVNGKDIVIYFGASWCGPCRKTEKQVFSTTKFLIVAIASLACSSVSPASAFNFSISSCMEKFLSFGLKVKTPDQVRGNSHSGQATISS